MCRYSSMYDAVLFPIHNSYKAVQIYSVIQYVSRTKNLSAYIAIS